MRGANIIQGSVSLDDENAQGCTEIVPGFHRYIGSWWEKVKTRGKVPDGHVHGPWEPRDIWGGPWEPEAIPGLTGLGGSAGPKQFSRAARKIVQKWLNTTLKSTTMSLNNVRHYSKFQLIYQFFILAVLTSIIVSISEHAIWMSDIIDAVSVE